MAARRTRPPKKSGLSTEGRALLQRAELRTIRQAHDIGRVIVEDIYGGDEEAFRSRSRGSLRMISGRAGVGLSIPSLWRAASVYLLCRRWPKALSSKHLRLSHLYAVLDLPVEMQTRLLRRAEAESWTCTQTKVEAARAKGKRGTRSRRVSLLIRSLYRVAESDTRRPPRLSAEDAAELRHALGQARATLNEMALELRDRRN